MRVDHATRLALAGRSGGWCEARLFGCLGRASEVQHRITVKMGGRKGAAIAAHNRLSNLLHLCHACHAWATSPDNSEAYELGLCLKEWQDTTQEPVCRRDELVRLDDYGGYDYADYIPGGER